MELVRLSSPAWHLGPIRFAETFFTRLRGIRSEEAALLLATRSVHAFWPARRLLVVGIDPTGLVVGLTPLRRARVVAFPTAVLVLELDSSLIPPVVGDRVAIDLSNVTACPAV